MPSRYLPLEVAREMRVPAGGVKPVASPVTLMSSRECCDLIRKSSITGPWVVVGMETLNLWPSGSALKALVTSVDLMGR